MSEEVKEAESTSEESPKTAEAPAEKAVDAPAEEAPKTAEAPVEKAADTAEAPAEQAAANKVKKIRNLSKEALIKKIAEFEDKGQVRSKYYEHLKRRQTELG